MARAKKKKKRGFGRDLLAGALAIGAWELVAKPLIRGRKNGNPDENGDQPEGEPALHSQHPHERAQQDELRYLDDRVRRIEAEHERAWREFGKR